MSLPKPFTEPEPAPPWSDFKMLQRRNFDREVSALYDLKKQMAVLKKQADAQQEKVKPLMEALWEAKEVKSVQVGEVRVTLSQIKGKKTLSAQKLLVLGVASEVIEEATETGKPSTQLRLTGPKDEDTEE